MFSASVTWFSARIKLAYELQIHVRLIVLFQFYSCKLKSLLCSYRPQTPSSPYFTCFYNLYAFNKHDREEKVGI